MKNIHAPPRHGRLITIDGIDATGKTTLAINLSERISGIYYKTPGKTSKKERKYFDLPHISVQERFNFYSGTLQEDILEISKFLKTWKNVVCDRFISSTIVHHKAMDENIDIGEIENINEYPWLIQILLIATKETVLDRLWKREELTRFEKDEDLMIKSQEVYMQRPFDLIINTTQSSVKQTLSKTLVLLNNSINYEKLLEVRRNPICKAQNNWSLWLVM